MKTKACLFSFTFFVFLFCIILISTAGAANKIMPLGDSITWDNRYNDFRSDGEKIAYRYHLWQLLTNAGYDINFVGSEDTGYDIFPDAENEGHPGWTDDDIAASVYDFLFDNPAKIILLHIGTNYLDPDPTGVKNILDEIDRYEADFGVKITVILARIINRSTYSAMTTLFNDNAEDMAFSRVNDPGDPAFPDKIIFGTEVDMEDGAEIDYNLLTDIPPGDMWDNLHPFEGFDSGYSKMANVWFSALEGILPWADAGPDQNVNEFELVTLDASGSNDPKGGDLSYQWVQTAGPDVELSDAQAVQPTFDAPSVGPGGETLTFRVTVTDEDDLESTDSVNIEYEYVYQNPGDELAGDFGTNGLWHYDGASWSKLTSWNTDEDLAGWSGGLTVDFGTNGLWNHDGSSWSILTGWNPGSGGLAGWNGGLAVDFDAEGLWSYDGSSWRKLTSWNPEGMAGWNGSLAVDFGTTNGLWSYDGSSWSQLTTWNPEGMTGWNGSLAVDFGADGLWSYDGSSWSQLTSWNPEGMAGWNGSLAVDFGADGLWSHDASSWSQLTSWNPTAMSGWGSGLAVNFGVNGLWNNDGSSWSMLTSWPCENMADVDLN